MALINSQNARLMAARSHESRRLRAGQCGLRANPLPQTPPQTPQSTRDFLAERLIRVRGLIVRVNELFNAEDDAHKLDRMASALARLSELERVLDGRPLPGSFRPARIKARPTLAPAMPLDD